MTKKSKIACLLGIMAVGGVLGGLKERSVHQSMSDLILENVEALAQ